MYTFEQEQLVPAPREEVFEFFSDVGKLGEITPRSVGLVDLRSDSRVMHAGMRIVHRIRWFGIPLRWSTIIEEYDPPNRFADRQVRGPYSTWYHEHIFEERDDGTAITDRIQYDLPFGILGEAVHTLLVKRQLREIFDYRRKKIRNLFAKLTTAP